MRVAMDRNSSPGAPFVPHWVDDVLRLASDARHRGPDVMSVGRSRSTREEVVQRELANIGGREPRRGGGGPQLLAGKAIEMITRRPEVHPFHTATGHPAGMKEQAVGGPF